MRTRTPCSLAPTSASALASSISFVRLSTRRSLSPRATKSRNRRMISPARKRLLGGLVHRVADQRRLLVRAVSSSRREPFM